MLAHFTNKQANALTDSDITDAAARLSVTVRQVRAPRIVEAAGRGYDKTGMPNILYERYKFHARTRLLGRQAILYANPRGDDRCLVIAHQDHLW